jgi:hypothetical protein
MEQKTVLTGTAIVVCDRGFVYVGNITVDDQYCVITKAHNVRYWGTEKGLGELALNGEREKTKLDFVGTVRVPVRAVISYIDTEEKLWKCLK